MANHDPDDELSALAASLDYEGLTPGQLFGKPCLKFGGKALIAAFHGDLVFKLADPGPALAIPGAHLWDPSGKGRAMKAWVVVSLAERAHWPELGADAIAAAP